MIHRKLYKSSTLAILSLFLTCPKILAESPRLEDHHLEVEKKIVNLVDSANEAALSLLERAVNINSGTMNFEGVRRVGSLFRAEFDALGFETEWIEGEAFSRAGHLVARRRGTGTGVLLIGHLDTVFEPDSPFQRFERLDATRARGPGIIDMKGGDVIIVQALKALAAADGLGDLDVMVIMTGDEEKSGRPLSKARERLKEMAGEADFALGFEDGDGNPATAVVARRGSTSWQLTAAGKPAHSSQIFQPEIGAGAVFELARVLNGFREELSGEELLTFNPGVVLGGTTVKLDRAQARGDAFGKNNVVAEHAVAAGDLRCISPEQVERTREKMRRIAADSLPGTSSRITFDDGYPPLAPTAENYRMLKLYDQVSRDLGLGPVEAVNPRNAGAADISFTSGLSQLALDGLGLMGVDGHTVKETADLTTLPSQTKRAAILLYRLSRGAAGDEPGGSRGVQGGRE